jgi:hypothetical protein
MMRKGGVEDRDAQQEDKTARTNEVEDDGNLMVVDLEDPLE